MHEFSSKRETTTYRYGEIETPFLKKDQNEDQQLGIHVKAMRFWRALSLIGLMISFLLLLVLIIEIFTPRAHVLAVEMLQNGFVKQAGWLTTKS